MFGWEQVFRIGGDEFAILFAGAERKPEELLWAFDKAVAFFNENGQKDYEEKLEVARGAAVYRAGEDQSFTDVSKRADQRMYENKRWQKSQNGGERNGSL